MYSAILYTSRTGSCKHYAELISAELCIPAVTMDKVPKGYGEKLLYIGWLCAGKIKGYKRACEKFNIGAVVQVGMAPVTIETEAQSRKANCIPADVPLFCLQGGFNMKKLPLPYRMVMKIINKGIAEKLSEKPVLNSQEQATLKMAQTGIGEPADWCITDVVAWCKAH